MQSSCGKSIHCSEYWKCALRGYEIDHKNRVLFGYFGFVKSDLIAQLRYAPPKKGLLNRIAFDWFPFPGTPRAARQR